MNEEELQNKIINLLDEFTEYELQTFIEAGVLTYNKGIVIYTDNETFQLTIVKSGGF